MTKPIDRIVTAVAAAQAVLASYVETSNRRGSAESTLVGLQNIFDDHELNSAMEEVGCPPLLRVSRLRVVQARNTSGSGSSKV